MSSFDKKEFDFHTSKFKAHFPLFSHPDNKQLVYFDNAATTQTPRTVINAISEFYLNSNGNANRSSHRLARKATDMLDSVRQKAAEFIGAPSAENIIFCSGATDGLNLIASGLAATLQSGDEIILSQAEHHANLVPWQMLAQRTGCQLKFIKFTKHQLQLEVLETLITNKTKILSITAASNTLGFKTDLKAVSKALQNTTVKFVVDASQIAAHEKLNVGEIDCDFLVCSPHKFYGPTGVGLCYGKANALKILSPFKGGGEMIKHVTLNHSTYAKAPDRFETGTAALASIAGLGACFDFWASLDRDALANHERSLCSYLHQKLQDIKTIQLLSQAQNNVGIASFYPLEGLAVADIGYGLDEQDIAIRSGKHCTHPLIQCLKIDGLNRVSIAAYNTASDVDRLSDALIRLLTLSNDNRPLASLAQAELSTSSNMKNTNDKYYKAIRISHSWQQKYKLLIQWGNELACENSLRHEGNLIEGCEANTWMSHTTQTSQSGETTHTFAVDSDSKIMKGLSAIVLHLISNKTSTEIKAINWEAALTELGIEKNLSGSRTSGFKTIIHQCLNCI